VSHLISQLQGMADGYNQALAASTALSAGQPPCTEVDGAAVSPGVAPVYRLTLPPLASSPPAACKLTPVTALDLWFFNSISDLPDVLGALYPEQQKDCSEMSVKALVQKMRRTEHCSVLIKPIPLSSGRGGALKDLYMSHNSWFDYRMMLRVMKSYDLTLPPAPGSSQPLELRVEFSSYPGFVFSMVWRALARPRPLRLGLWRTPLTSGCVCRMTTTSSPAVRRLCAFHRHYPFSLSLNSAVCVRVTDGRQLFVTETTNDICNATLYSLIQPQVTRLLW
jgi:hypothetical protein